MTQRRTEAVTFEGASGQLKGTIEFPTRNEHRAVAVFAHCFACGRNSLAAVRIARLLTDHGIATLRFDFAGIGESEGQFGEIGLLGNADDIVSAVDALADKGLICDLLIGHSYGGAAVIAAASRLPAVRNLVTIGAPFEVDHVLDTIGVERKRIEREANVKLSILGRETIISDEFVKQASNEQQQRRIAELDGRLLILHARDDMVVPYVQGERIFLAAGGEKDFVTLPGADHLLTAPTSAAQVADLIQSWFARSEGPEVADNRPLAATVKVATQGGMFTQLVQSHTHDWVADEPEDFGGDDLGPSPYDHLLAALGTCTSMTVMLYARRKNIPLEKVEIELEHGREHASDCAECTDESKRIDVLDRSLRLHGPINEVQKAELMRIANRCPVHRTLENRIEIKTTPF